MPELWDILGKVGKLHVTRFAHPDVTLKEGLNKCEEVIKTLSIRKDIYEERSLARRSE